LEILGFCTKGMTVFCSISICTVVLLLVGANCEETTNGGNDHLEVLNELGQTPHVLLSIIARNEEKTLPTYLGYIERLDYPKSHISIFIQTDHNEDKTEQRLKEWTKHAKLMYRNIKMQANSSEKFYPDSKGPNDWVVTRYEQVARLRQNALDEARSIGVDYLFFVDCDNFLLNPNTLKSLMAQRKTVVAPMIRAFENGTTYSNYWCGMDENGYYERTDDYFPMLKREKKGCFEVPMIHSTYLIDLQYYSTDNLQYYPPPQDYFGEVDDILIFAFTARKAEIKLFVLNQEEYGQMLTPSTPEMNLEDDQIAFTDAKIDWMAYNKPLISTNLTNHRPPPIDNLGFDEIYMINLARRPDRRKKMLMSLEELGLYANEQDAVDGRTLTKEIVEEMGIHPMKDFKDPYLERPMTMGEIGCFLSHWNIWKDVVANRLEYVLVLEDDIRFESDFNRKMRNLLIEAKELLWNVKWDLIYIGRKRMSQSEEVRVAGTEHLVWAKYSYWTLAYILRLSGARKLIAGDPFKQMIPVDEYIPIMFNDHNDAELMSKFPTRNLIALSVYPLYVYPTHYVGDEGYVSDTEGTITVYQKETNSTSENSVLDERNDSPEVIAERRFQQRKVSSRLQGDL